MDTEILNLILETLQAQEKKMKVLIDLHDTSRDRISELEYSENQLKKRLQAQEENIEDLEEKIQDIENIDIEDELRNSCFFSELEDKVLELEEPQGYITDIGDKSFLETNREELDGLRVRVIELERVLKGIGEALNK